MDKKELDYYYDLLYSTILSRQNVLTGLIPSHPDHPDAWVRDNTYASLSIWGLSLVYRKLPDVDEDRSRGYELEKCVVKLMRGILMCYMLQADKVETLKKFQNPHYSLHAKFDSNTCKNIVGDDEWGHLQIDAVSVYLLTLAQMTASGMRIIWTIEEVAFIQNLVFYIEHAYRIPDYGIWERGDKTNHGLPELNTSSVGMAKAALESISDLDLFGADGSPLSTIHVFPDETRQCMTVLDSVLPRESNSKETDAALLSIITYPGFAITDTDLIEKTRNTLVQKLLGKYGCRRFLRDGFRTAREDSSRLHYEPWELRFFEGIECEWPMFLAWLALDACFREDLDAADQYMSALRDVLIRETNVPCSDSGSYEKPFCRRISQVTNLSNAVSFALMPETYAVPAEFMDGELLEPHSQERVAVGTLPHIWGQSLYILASIINHGLLLPGEIDPLGRRLLTVPKPDLSVQVVLVAEDESMKNQILNDFQIELQTYDEIYNEAGIRIYPAKFLGVLCRPLGVCEKLKLSGRVTKEVGVLSTSQFYKLGNQTVAFIPQFFDHHTFYLNLDVNFILDCFRTCVAFLKRGWSSPGRPLLIFPIHHWYFCSTSTSALVSTIKKMATGYINGTRVTLGTLKNFEETSCIKQLNFLGSADKLDMSDSLMSPTNQSRRLTAFDRFVNMDDNPFSNFGTSSPTSASSSTVAHEQDNFYLLSLRRKSMMLAKAVTLDLVQRDTENSDVMDNKLSHAEDSIPEDMSHHLLRHRTESEDLSSSASKLALKRIFKSDKSESYMQPDVQLNINVFTPPSDIQSPISPSGSRLSANRSPSSSTSRRTSTGPGLIAQPPTEELLDSCTPEQLVTRLAHTDSIFEQVEILGRLLQSQGPDWDTRIDPTQPATVRTLLKEVYERASHSNSWYLLRCIAGLLNKRAGSLAKALIDILVLQKQVSVGLPPEPREIVIDAPLPPDEIAELIRKACGEDLLMNVLTQEILIYLSMVARTRPQLLAQIMRLRIGLIIQMMCSELARALNLNVDASMDVLFSMCPFDTKRLLLNLLCGEDVRMVKTARNLRRKSTIVQKPTEQARRTPAVSRRMSVHPRISMHRPSIKVIDELRELHATETRNLWSRRRKIDGALNRVPPGFYERVYIVLSRAQGLDIGGHILCSSLTREMTMEEHKFALTVDRVCTKISVPEYRQLLVEATHVLGSLISHEVDKCLLVNGVIKVEELVDTANTLFLLDQVKYDANATLCCAKIFKEQSITELSKAMSVRRSGSLLCHGQHTVCQHFYDTPPAGRFGTISYMVRAVSHLLQATDAFRGDGLISVHCNVQ